MTFWSLNPTFSIIFLQISNKFSVAWGHGPHAQINTNKAITNTQFWDLAYLAQHAYSKPVRANSNGPTLYLFQINLAEAEVKLVELKFNWAK